MSSEPDGGDDGASTGPDLRVLALVALCVVALLALAAMAPALADSPAGAEGGGGGGGSDGGEAGSDDGGSESGDSDGGESGGEARNVEGGGVGGSSLPDSQPVGGSISESAYRDAGTQVVAVVEANRPAYWRMGAYDGYDDERWHRTDAIGTRTPARDRAAGRTEVLQRVWLNRTMRTLPVAWEAQGAVVPDSSVGVSLEEDARLEPDEPLPAGATYRARSVAPPSDPERLRRAGTRYPDHLEAQYTDLPEDATTDRLVSFTDDLTADAETPYDEARTIEAWMRSEKAYDLQSSHDTSRPLFDEVVFEMDTVYCAYAASAMVGMLRTQGIPARYATGFSTGVADGEGRYVVTEQHAHAWVEVYFPGSGWVPFDPTPPDARQAGNRAAHQSDASAVRQALARYESQQGPAGDLGEFADADPVDGGETVAPDVDPQEHDSVTERTEDGYVIERDQAHPTPGTELEVTVRRDGEPVSGVVVLFEGEPVGTTDESGTVTGTVPWVERLTIAVDDSGDAASSGAAASILGSAVSGAAIVASGARNVGAASGGAASGGAANVGALNVGANAAGSPASANLRSLAQDDSGDGTSIEVETRGRIDVAVDGPALTGAETTVTATLDGNPVPDASVSVAGEERATTDVDGTARVALPDESGEATIRVQRGEITGTAEVTVEPLEVAVVDGLALPGATRTLAVTAAGEPLADHRVLLAGEPVGWTDARGEVRATLPDASGAVDVAVRGEHVDATRTLRVELPAVAVEDLLPLPGRPATVRVEHAGEPVEGATVAVDGEPVAQTTEGTASAWLPVANSATVTASVEGATAETTVSHLYANAAVAGALPLGVLLAALALLVRRLRREDASLRGALSAGWLRRRAAALRRVLSEVAARLVDATVRLGRALGRFAGRCAAAGRRLLERGRALASRVIDRGVAGLLALPGLLLRAGPRLLLALHPLRLWRRLRALLRGGGAAVDDSSASTSTYDLGTPAGGADDDGDGERLLRLRDVWRAFVRAVRPPRVATRTAGEIGRYAVRQGLPSGPVRTVVDTYREAEYGRTSPSPSRLERAADAVRSVAGDHALDGRVAAADETGDVAGRTQAEPGDSGASAEPDDPGTSADSGDPDTAPDGPDRGGR